MSLQVQTRSEPMTILERNKLMVANVTKQQVVLMSVQASLDSTDSMLLEL